jgi:ElaB/YqjD/DUF883 family membrane-anchored ribosome-binding protein
MADTSNIRDKAKDTAAAAGHAASEAKGLAQETAAALTQKAGEVASNLGQKAQDAAGQAKDRARDLASRAGDRAEDALTSAGQGMSRAAGALRQNVPQEGMLGSAAGAVADRLEAGGQYLQENSLSDMADDVAGMVRQHPLPALAIVFGVGFLLGSALRR